MVAFAKVSVVVGFSSLPSVYGQLDRLEENNGGFNAAVSSAPLRQSSVSLKLGGASNQAYSQYQNWYVKVPSRWDGTSDVETENLIAKVKEMESTLTVTNKWGTVLNVSDGYRWRGEETVLGLQVVGGPPGNSPRDQGEMDLKQPYVKIETLMKWLAANKENNEEKSTIGDFVKQYDRDGSGALCRTELDLVNDDYGSGATHYRTGGMGGCPEFGRICAVIGLVIAGLAVILGTAACIKANRKEETIF